MNMNLSNLWNRQNEKEEKVITTKEELAQYVVSRVVYKTDDMSPEEKEKMMAGIRQKIKSGKKLSPEEERYLQQTDPALFQQYQRIRAMADCMAERLKHARTKQEANDIITSSIAGVSKKDPYKEYVIAALDKVAQEFRKSPGYARLPNNDSDLRKRKTQYHHFKEERVFKEEDDFKEWEDDGMSWTPLQEIIDAKPTFHVSV